MSEQSDLKQSPKFISIANTFLLRLPLLKKNIFFGLFVFLILKIRISKNRVNTLSIAEYKT